MKFKFKIQDYQTDAVNAVVDVFNGQLNYDKTEYTRDMGKFNANTSVRWSDLSSVGYLNHDVELSDDELLKNIRTIQSYNNVKQSSSLNKALGKVALDVEMETGTGKTYVYIKTIFELNKRYGWSKFIIVVPSIAIREGVKKTFDDTKEHFLQHYGVYANYFIYNSSNLTEVDTFSKDSGIQVMIINTQAFARSFKEVEKGKKSNKEQLIIYNERESFGFRKPIDVIKANRPIIIQDEPQKMGGKVTQVALKNFNPLFSLYYSATHKEHHDTVYRLDALDAFNEKLVKKIQVKGIDVKSVGGANSYLYLSSIEKRGNKPPVARMEIEVSTNSGVQKKIVSLSRNSQLYTLSGNMEQYRDGYEVDDIDAGAGTVTFSNGTIIGIEEAIGDVSEKDKRRIQIRQTIISHFQKEEQNFTKGIKTLSLFFIDEVAKYRLYDENGEQQLGEYGVIFEQEYTDILNQYITMYDTPYQKYLKEHCSDASVVHNGYFSVDKKGKMIDSATKRGSEFSDDISAYDLILKNKERLLSFEEPTRFIFSHSALSEGWDNPNVFQICTLRHTGDENKKRQEVGRGLRLCVNQDGTRMDVQSCGDEIFKWNTLTVIAPESYANFVGGLQKKIKEELELANRPKQATIEYFEGKVIKIDDNPVTIDEHQAKQIYRYLIKNDYVDENDKITDEYRNDLASGTVVELPDEMKDLTEGVQMLIQAVYDDSIIESMFGTPAKSTIKGNKLNENFDKPEFQQLWDCINKKYAYTVDFESTDLIKNSIIAIDTKLFVTQLQYKITIGEQKDNISFEQLGKGSAFTTKSSSTEFLDRSEASQVPYDLIGKIVAGTRLTRKTIAQILTGISSKSFAKFKINPEEFITRVTKLVNDEKADIVVDSVVYHEIEGKYDPEKLFEDELEHAIDKVFEAKKHIQPYVVTDSDIEIDFAKELDIANEVCVYAKLPRTFQIPTPVGNYAPDWAIAFDKNAVKHIFFVVETKGTTDENERRGVENAKIKCAKKLFNEMSTSKVKYYDVDSYQTLLNKIRDL